MAKAKAKAKTKAKSKPKKAAGAAFSFFGAGDAGYFEWFEISPDGSTLAIPTGTQIAPPR